MNIYQLIRRMLKVGLIGFGGGSALIPVIEDEVVGEQPEQGISKEEYDDMVMVACVTPGALPVELAGMLGTQISGGFGMLAGALSMALPGAILTLLFLILMENAQNQLVLQIQYASLGVTAFIALMLVNYIMEVIRGAACDKGKVICAIALVFALTGGKNISRLLGLPVQLPYLTTIQVLLCAFVLLGLSEIWKRHRYTTDAPVSSFIASNGRQHYGRNLVICVLFSAVLAIPACMVCDQSLLFMVRGWMSSLVSFGGGDAYLTVADGMFVATSMIEEDIFYGKIVPVINALPGSILCKTMTGIGYYLGLASEKSVIEGVMVAVAGIGVSVAASCFVVNLVRLLVCRFQSMSFFLRLKNWIRPIVSGLLITVILSLLTHAQKMAAGHSIFEYTYILYMAILYVFLVVLQRMLKPTKWKLVIVSVAGALLMCNFLH